MTDIPDIGIVLRERGTKRALLSYLKLAKLPFYKQQTYFLFVKQYFTMVFKSSPQQYRLPDTLKDWPWPRQINSHHDVVKAEATEWLHSFNAFSPKAQAAFDACDFRKPIILAMSFLFS